MPDPRDLHAVERDAREVAERALREDGIRDVTSLATVAERQNGIAVIEARAAMVFAGRRYADAVVAACGLAPIEWQVHDGEPIDGPRAVATVRGDLRAILRAERPLLNLLQRASGIATMTRKAVDATAGTGCVVLHTRKTTPGLRTFEVRAVLDGGGGLHRVDLAHAVMVKDNHWQALRAQGRTLASGLNAARAMGVAELQVEVESLAQVMEACEAGATRLLVDNQTPETLAEWAARARAARPAIQIEATGGITLETLRSYALAGADFISTGMLTHSVVSADLGVELGLDG